MPDQAVVLAAGLGTRLKWLTRDRPKALMRLGRRTLIEQVILSLARAGVRRIAVNAHYRAEALFDALGDGRRLGVEIRYSLEPELLDSGGGVRTALELLDPEAPFVVHNADVLADIDFRALARPLEPGGAVLALVANPAHHPGGDFALHGGRLACEGSPRWTYAGVSVWGAGSMSRWPVRTPFPLTGPIRTLIGEGRARGVVHLGVWHDLGRPRDLFRARWSEGGLDVG